MNDGLKVEYSKDENQVCIIPNRTIPVEHFVELTMMFSKFGYKWWLPADERGGYILSKVQAQEKYDN